VPDKYQVMNQDTVDSDFDLIWLAGDLPSDIKGSLYLAQCLGTENAYMVGDTNIVRIDFLQGKAKLKNRKLWTPATVARLKLRNTAHKFDFFGLFYLSPGMGMSSYSEGVYLLPGGRIAVTSDVDRPWIIDRKSLRATTPVGRRTEWLPLLEGSAGKVLGSLFSGRSNSHVVYTDHRTREAFLVNYQTKQPSGDHPVYLIRWTGSGDFERWLVTDERDNPIEIKQSVHELVFTQDYIILADTAFAVGTEFLTPWRTAEAPSQNTVVYIIDRRTLENENESVIAKRVAVEEAAIHLIAEYDNPDDKISILMLHSPATNTAEVLRSADRDLNGDYFPERLSGFGTLPPVDLSSVGKHVIDMKALRVEESTFLADRETTWAPYMYAYFGRQKTPYKGQDLFVMFRGFSRSILPKRIFEAYKEISSRRIAMEDMMSDKSLQQNHSISRIATEKFEMSDSYFFPDRVHLFTIACLELPQKDESGYLIAGIVTDELSGSESSGHEYWLFDAYDLAAGPICKLGHKSLNNTTLFHSLYLSADDKKKLGVEHPRYHIDLRKDYPSVEVKKWRPEVLSVFEKFIWPYFDKDALDHNKEN
jgi:carotenoid cleavage dioxygenase-like enzyme